MQCYPSGPSVRTESTSTAEISPQEQCRPGSRNIKRKVLRKRNGESKVFDESFASTDSGKINQKYSVSGFYTNQEIISQM